MASAKGAIAGLPTYKAMQHKDGSWWVWRREVTLWGVEPTITGEMVDTGNGSTAWAGFRQCKDQDEAERLASSMNSDADDFADRF